MNIAKLVAMANRIAGFFAAQPGDAAAATARHMAETWEPRLRAALARHHAAGGEGLDPVARAAAARLDRDG